MLSEIARVHHWLEPDALSGVCSSHVLETLISKSLEAMLLAFHSNQCSLVEQSASLQWCNSPVNQKSLFMQKLDRLCSAKQISAIDRDGTSPKSVTLRLN